MNQNFDKCMSMLLAHEGGYVNHPSDPGGMTNLGVTKRTYDEYHGTDVTEDEMKALTKADVEPIYRRNYWDRCRCPDLPTGVDGRSLTSRLTLVLDGLQRLSSKL